MEDNNQNSANPAPQQAPAPQPAVVKSNLFGAKNWLIALGVLYFLSLAPALMIISKIDSKSKKTMDKTMDDNSLSSALLKKDAVGVIPVYGTIYQDSSGSFVEKGSQQIVVKIKKMGKDKNIKAIVLDINSPGGSVGAVQEIYSTILKVKAETKKPFVAHFGEVSASGGYYIAAACDKIVSQGGTITGSIGVIFSLGNVEGLFKKIGLRYDVIKSGKFKDIGSMTREMSREEKELLQAMIDDSYASFVEAVSAGRKIPKEKLVDIADGRVFTGNQALKSGLVDKIGDLQDTIDEAGIMSGLGKNPRTTRSRSYSFEDLFSLVDVKLGLFNGIRDIKNDSPKLEYRWAGF